MFGTNGSKNQAENKGPKQWSHPLIPGAWDVTYLILVGISHISMPCSIDNNVDETWPQYLSPATCPLIINTSMLLVLQLISSKPVLRGFIHMKGTGGELLLLLLYKPVQRKRGMGNLQRVGSALAVGVSVWQRLTFSDYVLFGPFRFEFRESRPVHMLCVDGTKFTLFSILWFVFQT